MDAAAREMTTEEKLARMSTRERLEVEGSVRIVSAALWVWDSSHHLNPTVEEMPGYRVQFLQELARVVMAYHVRVESPTEGLTGPVLKAAVKARQSSPELAEAIQQGLKTFIVARPDTEAADWMAAADTLATEPWPIVDDAVWEALAARSNDAYEIALAAIQAAGVP